MEQTACLLWPWFLVCMVQDQLPTLSSLIRQMGKHLFVLQGCMRIGENTCEHPGTGQVL